MAKIAPPVARVAAGVPSGGEFTTAVRGAAEVTLTATPAQHSTTWRDWWPDTTGAGTIDASSWTSAAQEVEWVRAWNATPKELRRPLELIHGSPQADLDLRGAAHFGDRGTAMDRLFNTLDDVEGGYLHTYEFRGDIVPLVLPDTTANLLMHPESPFRNEFYDRMAFEIEELGVDDVEEFLERAEALHTESPDAALAYLNNTEGLSDGDCVSLALDAANPDLRHVSSRPVGEEDLEWITG